MTVADLEAREEPPKYMLPAINEVPEQFSPFVLWHFRLASLGIQAVLWTTIGFCSALGENAA